MMKRITAAILALILVLAMVSAAGAENFGYKAKKSSPVQLTVHEDSKVGLGKGGRLKLTMTKADGTALTGVSFRSSRTKVATVSASGIVKGKKAGKARITMTAETGESYALTVTVADPAAPDKLSFSKGGVKTFTGMKTDLVKLLKAKPYTEALNKKKLIWSSSNIGVASVDKNGVMTAQSTGKAVITVKAPNGKTASIRVTVQRNVLDHLQRMPQMTDIDYGEQIYLKSVEIVHPGMVLCEYWLLFRHLPSTYTTYFSWVEDHIKLKGGAIELVDGSAANIAITAPGQSIRLFKVLYTGDAVVDTNVKLAKYKNKISWDSSFWLNWKY